MTADWTWDDESIPPEELLLRRVPRKPDCVLFNVLTNAPEVKAGALQFDPNDGMSVHSDKIRAEIGVPRTDICDWERYTAVEFEAGVVRPDGGVVRDPQEGEHMGEAHGLIRTPTPIATTAEKKAIRMRIARSARFVPEDPNPVTG